MVEENKMDRPTKKRAIKAMKDIIKQHERIKLGLGEIASATYIVPTRGRITSLEWKHIGYVSSLSWSFNIKPEDLE